ncbi:MAG: adenosylmethionine--8-amino-7-oxononanoate transaminase [Alphaproteobacteria bacterium]
MTAKKPSPATALSDRTFVWHPFTQAKTAAPPIEVVEGRGATLIGADGREYLDLISSWWVTVHGHGEPRIAAAIAAQARKLEHVIFADVTHDGAAALARRIAALLPGDLTRVFFSDNGSTAVEVSLKIALQYWRNLGQPKRRRLVGFEGGYHGDTFGAMSVGATSGFFEPFRALLPEALFLPFPATWDDDPDAETKEDAALASARRLFEEHGEEIAAVIIEPLVQGAGGMRMCRPSFLSALARLVREAGALLIFDEVMTGFGRTGAMFACVKADVAPDMICLAKGLTGGFLPLALTACRPRIFDAFLDDDFERAFAHGHSYTANPIGCAAALASLDIFEADDTLTRVAALESLLGARLRGLARHPKVTKARHLGGIAAFDVAGGEPGYTSGTGPKLKRFFLERGLIIRPLGNVVYLMPPYCLAAADVHRAFDAIGEALEQL